MRRIWKLPQTSALHFRSELHPNFARIQKVKLKSQTVDATVLFTMSSRVSFKNGSLVRERIRDSASGGSWDGFSLALSQTPLGNHGNIGFYFDVLEILPAAVGVHRFDAQDNKVESFPTHTEVRALVEGQFLSKRLHAERLGYSISPGTRVLATGGASSNTHILQVLSDIFNAPVYAMDSSNSACLGSAYRALHGVVADSGLSFSDAVTKGSEPKLMATPDPCAKQVYDEMLKRFGQLEERVLQESCPHD